jgi:hypothetical protein
MMTDFERWANHANGAIMDFARVAKTQVVADIGPYRAEWKWGTRSCVATLAAGGKDAAVRFDDGLVIPFPLHGEEAANSAGGTIASNLLKLG